MALEMCPNSSSYEASPLVTAFHSIPHIDINLNQNVTEFENTLDYYEVSWRHGHWHGFAASLGEVAKLAELNEKRAFKKNLANKGIVTLIC